MKRLLFVLLTIPMILQGQIIGSWKMNGSSSDGSGNGYNGTDYYITYSQGISGQCALFNGTTSGIVFSITNSFPINASARTINLWCNSLTPTTNNAVLFIYGSSASTGRRFNLNIDTVNSRINIGFGTAQEYSSAFTYKNKWNMITAVVPVGADSTNDVLIYINGVLSATTFASSRMMNTIQDLRYPSIGTATATNTPSGTYFKGYIDDVQIWNTAWSAAYIKNNYSFYKGFFQ